MSPPEVETPYSKRWYDVVEDDSLRQGDIFLDLLVFWHPQDIVVPEELMDAKDFSLPSDVKKGCWILLTASCDIERKDSPQALLAPVIPAISLKKGATDKEFNLRLESMKQGLHQTKFLLPASNELDPEFPISFVEFRQYLTVPAHYLKNRAVGKRLRLRHPFREMLGAWAGGCLSRIGPEDDWNFPRFAPRLHDPVKVMLADSDPEVTISPTASTRPARRPWWKPW
jgi:hypothetical protein